MVPVGGGGLAAGVAVAVRGARPDVQVIGVQAEAVAPYPASIAAGTRAGDAGGDDGRRHRGRPGPASCPSACCPSWAPRCVTVSEENLSRAPAAVPGTGQAGGRAGRARPASPPLLEHPAHIDPAGRRGAVRRQHRPAAAVQAPPPWPVGGGPLPDLPVPPAGPARRARHPAHRAGRLGANVLDVVHERCRRPADRRGRGLVHLETRGPEHADTVIGQLRAGRLHADVQLRGCRAGPARARWPRTAP